MDWSGDGDGAGWDGDDGTGCDNDDGGCDDDDTGATDNDNALRIDSSRISSGNHRPLYPTMINL